MPTPEFQTNARTLVIPRDADGFATMLCQATLSQMNAMLAHCQDEELKPVLPEIMTRLIAINRENARPGPNDYKQAQQQENSMYGIGQILKTATAEQRALFKVPVTKLCQEQVRFSNGVNQRLAKNILEGGLLEGVPGDQVFQSSPMRACYTTA